MVVHHKSRSGNVLPKFKARLLANRGRGPWDRSHSPNVSSYRLGLLAKERWPLEASEYAAEGHRGNSPAPSGEPLR